MQGWKEEVEKVIGPGKPCVLVGNKTDLADSGNREISEQEGEALRNEFNAGAYFETSAKQNLKVSPAFKELTLAILKASGKI